MRNRVRNKILSFALAAVMLLGVFTAAPMTAYADVEIQAGAPALTVNSATVMFGGHEWVVIGDESDGVTTTNANHYNLLHSNDCACQ